MMRYLSLLFLVLLNNHFALLFAADSLDRGGAKVVDFSVSNTYAGDISILQGIVTWIDKERNLMVLQDGLAAIAVRVDLLGIDLSLGDRVVLKGHLAPFPTAFPDYPDNPTKHVICPAFEAPTNIGENYLTRMRGYLRPPATGKYIFWIASDDSSELFLSENDSPAKTRRIARVENGRWTEPRQWNRFPSQKSQEVLLKAGETYYIEAVSQQGWGKDCLAVAWKGPGFLQAVIDGKYLGPWTRAGDSLEGSILETTTNGILWEYWRNFYSSDLDVLKVSQNNMWNLRQPQVVEKSKAELPDPEFLEIGQTIKPGQNFCRVEVAGHLLSFANKGGRTEMELVSGSSRVQIHVIGDMTPPLENSVIRVRGVGEALRNPDNELMIGHIWVNGTQDVSWLDAEENWSQLKITPMYRLTPLNPDLPPGRLLQVRGRAIRQESPGVWSMQGDDGFEGFTSADGVNWNSIGAPLEFAMNDSALAGVAIASHQANGQAEVKLDHINGLSGDMLEADIGDPPLAGACEFNQGVLSLRGSGYDIWGAADQCHFAYQAITGDRELIAHVASLENKDPQAKVGMMFRESLDSRAPWAAMVFSSGDRVGLQGRRESGKNSAGTLVNQPVRWLKITRHRQSLLIQPHDADKIQPGQVLDVIGRLSWKNEKPLLTEGYFRKEAGEPVINAPEAASDSSAFTGELHDVQAADLIAESQNAQLAGHTTRSRIRGVVTFNSTVAGAPMFFVQDASGVCQIQFRASMPRELFPVGHMVEITGGSLAFTNSLPELIANGIADIGPGIMPKPLSYPFPEPNRAGEQAGQWVEINGVVRSTGKNGTLSVMASGGPFSVWAGNVPEDRLKKYVNAMVQVRGVFWRSPAYGLLLPAEDFIQVKEPSPQDAFDIPTYSTALLRSINASTQSLHRMKIAGTVTCVRSNFFFVQDEAGGVRVEGALPPEIRTGEAVEIAGFPSRQALGLILTEPLVRKTGSIKSMPATALSLNNFTGERNNCLVTVDAMLLEKHFWRGMEILDLQSGQRAFRATLPVSAEQFPLIANGSRVRLTGINQGESSSIGNAGGDEPMGGLLELLLRNPGDVIVLQPPPWWNWKFTVAAVSFFAVVLGGSMVWIRLLRQRVEQRTRELRETMIKLRNETQVSATLAERDRLAGEIHDGLEQGLSAIMMQLDGLESKMGNDSVDAARHLKLARSMVRFSRTEVRHSLWDWQSPALSEKGLGGALSEIAAQMSAGNGAGVSVDISGQAVPLPARTEHHLLRIVQEALNNALKYAQASIITINLNYGDDAIGLTVRDNGRGFDPQEILSGTGGHFGLGNLRSRARKMGGTLNITSSPGGGTVIEASVPLPKSDDNKPDSSLNE